MYVQYMIPVRPLKPSIVLIHGAVLTGKSFETTPDGRAGWYEYLVRKGFGTYVVDQVGRGRSGFDPAVFNNVRAGVTPPASQPNVHRIANDMALVRFRIKPANGPDFADSQYPAGTAGELAKQSVPDLAEALPSKNPTVQALAELGRDLGPEILIGHSQAGRFPFDTALLSRDGLRGLVAVEPAGCNAAVYDDHQISELAGIPILIIFGDHLDAPQAVGVRWDEAYADCQNFGRRLQRAGGNITIFHPADQGIRGNSHLIMQDRNNLQIADYIVRWIDELGGRRTATAGKRVAGRARALLHAK